MGEKPREERNVTRRSHGELSFDAGDTSSSVQNWKAVLRRERLFLYFVIRISATREALALATLNFRGQQRTNIAVDKSNTLTSLCRKSSPFSNNALSTRRISIFALRRIKVIERIAAPDCPAPADQEAHLSGDILFGVAASITPLASRPGFSLKFM